MVLAYLRVHAATLKSLEPAVRADEFDAVHQMRVATRRLRAVLRSFGPVIPRSDSQRLAGELKWLGGLLGAPRDAEVLSAHLQESLRPIPAELLIGPVLARVQGHFAPRRAAARTELLEALDSPRYAGLLAELDRLAAGPLSGPQAGDPARDVLPAGVHKAYRQARKRMRRARHTPSGPARDAALHQARKSARRARYAAEAARPAIGQPARGFARQMKKVQSVLGDHQRRRHRQAGVQGSGHRRAPGRRERVHLRPAVRARGGVGRAAASRRAPGMEAGLPLQVPPLDELGPKNSVSHAETTVLRCVRGRRGSCNLAGTMWRLVFFVRRSGDL